MMQHLLDAAELDAAAGAPRCSGASSRRLTSMIRALALGGVAF